MSRNIRLVNNFLEILNEDELYLLINMIPKERLFEPIKRNQKEFKNDTDGYRIDIKSKLFRERLIHIYVVRIKAKDIIIMKHINVYIKGIIEKINKNIFQVTSDEEFFEKAIESKSINDFEKLIDIILEEIYPKNMKVFFKIIGQDLTINQNKYISTEMESRILTKKITEKVSKELQKKHQQDILNIKSGHNLEIHSEIERSKRIQKKLNEELNNMELQINDERTYSNTLCGKIEKVKIQSRKEINESQSHIKKLSDKIDIIEIERAQLKDIIEDKNLTINKLSKELNAEYDKYSASAMKRWNIENEMLIKSQNLIKKECDELSNRKFELKEELKTLTQERLKIENKILESENIIKGFIDNIDEKIIENALSKSMIKLTANSSIETQSLVKKSSNLYIKHNETVENIKICNNIESFAENIAINLENVGVKDTSDEVANYIIGILASGMIPLICGYKAREIATAISASYNGETPYIMTLPTGYTNSNELLEIYNSAKSDVILIEDAVGTMNENALMPLFRERSAMGFSKKLLILSTENLDSVKFMPHNLFNQVALVMINKYGMKKNVPYEFSDSRKVLKDFAMLESFEEEHKKIRKLLYNLKLGSPYSILRSIIVAYSHKISNLKEALEGYVMFELKFRCDCDNMGIDLEKNIQKYQLDNGLIDIIRGNLYE
ncbi:hypothetical protein [Clostridium algidicarnis]|uniref:hypothetical protein n=1 Tax=Clostridium algidicarnis TaxID=37659 RepID=UPI001C0AA57E|nr:hypothetical protein [Clostridium algidicarnis]MBU3203604.1 hypothetical protein [Clostridium algidicarnis]MBU3211758.1 hypothetical protein [Clostridium algidicarnis]MBU3221735.1 hypothetical protein [Clostridium algidicarnis]